MLNASASKSIRVLVVDDDPQIRSMLQRYLEDNGYRVDSADGGTAMMRVLDRKHTDLIVLDVMMPGEDGISLCRRVRTNSAVPIILLTAASNDTDRIIGLEVGADDYLAKPFNPRELLARMRAVLRRYNGSLMPPPPEVLQVGIFENWRIDIRKRTLFNAEGKLVDLTSNEFDLLCVFVQKPQTLLSRDRLLELIHGRHSNQLYRSIDVQISRLRRKIELDPDAPQLIKTMRSEGYLFAAAVTAVKDLS